MQKETGYGRCGGSPYESNAAGMEEEVTIREMFADERCTGAVLDVLRTTRVGARTGPPDPGGEREEGDTRAP